MNDLHAGLADIFEVEPDEIRSDTPLADLSWDSLAMVSTIALFDELYGAEVKIDDLKACRTVGDLEALASA
jgi:acyl carrier protein